MSVLDMSTRIQARAMALDPIKVLLFVILLPFYMVGATFRLVWFVLAFVIAAGMDGWSSADAAVKKRQQRQ